MKNSASLGVACCTSLSVSADWASDRPDATETRVEKPELERDGSVMPYVRSPSATAFSMSAQVTLSGFQFSFRTVAFLTPMATGLDMTGVSDTICRAAVGLRRR